MKNNHILSIAFAVFISAIIGKTSIAQDMFKDNFSNNEQWRYIADDVMGGVSTGNVEYSIICLLYTSPSPRDRTRSRMPSSA